MTQQQQAPVILTRGARLQASSAGGEQHRGASPWPCPLPHMLIRAAALHVPHQSARKQERTRKIATYAGDCRRSIAYRRRSFQKTPERVQSGSQQSLSGSQAGSAAMRKSKHQDMTLKHMTYPNRGAKHRPVNAHGSDLVRRSREEDEVQIVHQREIVASGLELSERNYERDKGWSMETDR